MKAFVHDAGFAIRVHADQLAQLIFLAGTIKPGTSKETTGRISNGIVHLALGTLHFTRDQPGLVGAIPKPDAPAVADDKATRMIEGAAVDLQTLFHHLKFS